MAKHADAAKDKLRKSAQTNAFALAALADEDAPESVTPDQESAGAAVVSETTEDEAHTEDAARHDVSVEDEADGESDDADSEVEDALPAKKIRSLVRLATVVGSVLVVSFGALAGWFGWQTHQSHQDQEQRELLVQVARQGALNLTTIDWQHADSDIQRILDSATGVFYDDFSHRSRPFIDVVKKAQSKSVGTITDAGLESQSGNEAQVLVAVSVKTSNLGATEQDPRHWRMRITVQKVGNEEKVSNVVFVP